MELTGLALSLVLTLSNAVVLFSLLTAADSRSGHSARLTNSNSGSSTASSSCEELEAWCEPNEIDLGISKGLGSSETGVVTVSLKRSKEAATLRPMPVEEPGMGCVHLGGLLEEEEEEAEDERRDRGRIELADFD